jgi:hypothetical protein
VVYRTLVDLHPVREVVLGWSAERRLLPAAELFRQQVLDRARTAAAAGCRPPPPAGPGRARPRAG